MTDCVCRPQVKNGHHANTWIQDNFQDCVYNTVDLAAFVIGMSSLAFWICCQAPQFIKNWRNGTAEALSFWFLLEWLGGDLSNMIGTILTRQVPTQKYSAILFVVMNVCMLTQYIFLHLRNKWRRQRLEKRELLANTSLSHEGQLEASELASAADPGDVELSMKYPPHTSREKESNDRSPSSSANTGTGISTVAAKYTAGIISLAVVAMLMASHILDEQGQWEQMETERLSWARSLKLDNCKIQHGKPTPHARELAGQVLGYISSTLYVNSRIPQVYRNCKRGSVVGLSWFMFFCAFMGNLTIVVSIIMRIQADFQNDRIDDWKAEAPFFSGSCGNPSLRFCHYLPVHHLCAKR
eukprot:gb/GECG01008906.1/.p1 GENE.gb/GECG01008906.1/~~gb/GECG01008906.1/.p1  ORF type:complete len:354 (+),score=22.69 gb/GECG01008906.1/:1-1062(+)